MSFEWETLSEVVALLKTKEARDNGVEERIFHRNGILSIESAALELRRRGYEVELFEDGGGSADASAGGPFGRRAAATEGSAFVPGCAPAPSSRPLRRGGVAA